MILLLQSWAIHAAVYERARTDNFLHGLIVARTAVMVRDSRSLTSAHDMRTPLALRMLFTALLQHTLLLSKVRGLGKLTETKNLTRFCPGQIFGAKRIGQRKLSEPGRVRKEKAKEKSWSRLHNFSALYHWPVFCQMIYQKYPCFFGHFENLRRKIGGASRTTSNTAP